MLTVLRHPTDLGFTSACRCATGRSAILHMARRWNPDVVFMPAYVPEGVINPFIESDTPIVFYRLTRLLQPDVTDLLEKLKSATSRSIIVAIEYFGYPAWYGSLRGDLPGYEGLIFFDCAHSTKTNPYADVSLRVFNKLIPVTDGAVIYSRTPELDLTVDEQGLYPLPAEAIHAYERHLLDNKVINDTKDVNAAEVALVTSGIHYETYYKIINQQQGLLRAQSSASRVIEGATDWYSLGKSRRQKSDFLRRNLPKRLSVGQDAGAQFAYPIRCHGRRDEMVDALNSINIIAGANNERWDHIPDDSAFAFEQEFIDDHLLLPLGEEVDGEYLVEMCNVLRQFK